LGNLKGLLRSQNGVFCEIFRVNQIFLNAFAEKRYFKEVPYILGVSSTLLKIFTLSIKAKFKS
jgi:hypothetical protein